MIAFYAVVLLLALWFKATVLLYVWIVPALLGQPFLRLYLLAEHGRCPLVANMLENTRTTLTNWLVRKLAWNMPYHAEHHAYPGVPFHQLPAVSCADRAASQGGRERLCQLPRQVYRHVELTRPWV